MVRSQPLLGESGVSDHSHRNPRAAALSELTLKLTVLLFFFSFPFSFKRMCLVLERLEQVDLVVLFLILVTVLCFIVSVRVTAWYHLDLKVSAINFSIHHLPLWLPHPVVTHL